MMTVISITYSAIAPLMLGFATIGLGLFYFAYRYNLLFVDSSVIDTKGLVYAKALQHTLVGCYLAVLCLIGLFGIRAAPGPLVLMVVLLVIMVLYHISMTSAVDPLLHYLPRSLEIEEAALLEATGGSSPDVGADGYGYAEKNVAVKDGPGQTKVSMASSRSDKNKSGGGGGTGTNGAGWLSKFKKFFRPDVYASYAVLRKLVPHDFVEIRYSPEIERDAYQDPAVNAAPPLLWVPRDDMGVSRQECLHTNTVTPMTDEGAFFDEKGKIVWDEEASGGRPPIFEEKIYY
ncbi:hypothetical protein ABEF94_000195 [Exophiala dermatitidis]